MQEKGPDGKLMSSEAAARKKLAHFLSRYDAHKKSAELEQKSLGGKGKHEVGTHLTLRELVSASTWSGGACRWL